MVKKWYAAEWNFFRGKLFVTFFTILALWFASITLMYEFSIRHPNKAESITAETFKEHEGGGFEGKNRVKTFFNLFVHNLLLSVVTAVSGFVPFLFLPILFVIGFGGIFGAQMAYLAIHLKDYGLLLGVTMPHGIFEFQALVYAASIGLYMTRQMSKKVIRRQFSEKVPFRVICSKAGSSFILVVAPLLLIAAFIEAFVTLRLFLLLGGAKIYS